MNRIILVLIAVAVLVGSISVSAAEKPYNDPNAALRYLMAIGFMPAITDDEGAELGNVESMETFDKLPASLRKIVGQADDLRIKNQLEAAANCSQCNFMPDASFKPEDAIPPYKLLRKFARFLNAGAWKAIKEGRHEDGAKLLVAVFRFGDDSENYGPLISYMIGHAIREIAVKSMTSFLAGDCRPEARKIVTDYLKALPRPAFALKDGFLFEKAFSEKMIGMVASDPKDLVEILALDDSYKPVGVKPQASACNANQRVLMGALEMAAMDGINFAENADFTSIQDRLVKDKYILKGFECPKKGQYKVEFIPADKEYKVSCSCGSNPDSPSSEETVAQAPKDPKLVEKALEYHSSGKFAKDLQELSEYYDKILAIDESSKDAEPVAEALQADYTKRDNLLIKTTAADFQKCFEKQAKLQEAIDQLIK